MVLLTSQHDNPVDLTVLAAGLPSETQSLGRNRSRRYSTTTERIPTMHCRPSICVAMTALCVLAVAVRPSCCDEPKKEDSPGAGPTQQARNAVERGLVFLE